MRIRLLLFAAVLAMPGSAFASPPMASYLFPAGGQRGTKVDARVGGLFLHEECGFEMLGAGVRFPKTIKRRPTLWFEGPLLPIPDSQRQEDYPKDMAAPLMIDADAALGTRHWRVSTSQGVSSALKFVVGDLPEVVEAETEGDPIPTKVSLPVTINGRIFPRQDIDAWSFDAKRGEAIRIEATSVRLGSPLDARLSLLDPDGVVIVESEGRVGVDPVLRFEAPREGTYRLLVQDAQQQGGQAYVYRVTFTRGPVVDAYFPLGGKKDTSLDLSLSGIQLPQATAKIPLPAQTGPQWLSLPGMPKDSPPLMVDVDDLPEAREGITTHAVAPVVLNGRIEKAGEIDSWPIVVRKGETIEVELRAGRLGSRLDGILELLDAAGKSIAKAEGTTPQPDPTLKYTATADGTLTLQVRDRFRSRGGLDFGYRVRVTQAADDFRLTAAADSLTIQRKGKAKLKLNVDRRGSFKEPIALQVEGLSAGVSVKETTIAANQQSLELNFDAAESAKIQQAKIRIVGTATTKTDKIRRIAATLAPFGETGIEEIALAVGMPTPFVIKGEYDMGFAARGGMHKRKYVIERNGYEGPLEISLADRQARHLQGVTMTPFVVAPGKTEFEMSCYLPPWMETGRTCRVCVQGVGLMKDAEGREHRICYSSVHQNEQLVAVVGPGRLGLEADRRSFLLQPGQTLKIPVRIKRGSGVTGVAKVELDLPPSMQVVSMSSASIPADRNEGVVEVRCAATNDPPPMPPTRLRATVMVDGMPVVAELDVELQIGP
ncbi:MAG: hypothetical protein K2X38_15450 [Gemmataceae bacterium]|nr:hypothetical protein [Gemmataceae bacterium]